MDLRRSRTGIIILAALMAGLTAAAQQPGSGAGMPPGQQPNTPNTPSQPSYPGGDMSTGSNNPQTYGDQSFLRKTLESSVGQVQIGQLAAEKGSSDDVKTFGQKMADIHQQLATQLKPIAQKLGVEQPKNPSKKDKEEIAKMQTLSGTDFDTAFIQAMLRDQQTDLKGFKNEAQSAQDPTVQQVAKMDEPVLSQHLQILQKIAQTHNVPTTSESEK
jgi:putative membrane protein